MFSDIFVRLRSLFRRKVVERELDEELRFRLEHETDKYVRAGVAPEEAARRARLEFGGVEQVRQTCREARGVTLIATFSQDIRYALRGFLRNPALTLVIVATLALGVGANTAVFSVINAVMLRSLPVQEPSQLVQVTFQGKHDTTSFTGESFSYALFKDLRKLSPSFADLAAFDSWDSFEAEAANRDAELGGERIKGQFVSNNFFSMLGLNAAAGRTFSPGEESDDGGHPIAVISYTVWQRDFAGDAGVISSKLLVRGIPLTIIGVAPRRFTGVNPGKTFGLWVPLQMAPQLISAPRFSLADPSSNWLSVMARIRQGVSPTQATEQLDALYQQLQRTRDISSWSPDERRDFFTHHIALVRAANGADYLRKEFSRPLWLLMGMVGLVLVIACANVVNLLLVRASTRDREIAVRVALGASGWRVLRQLLTESVLLAVTASGLALFLAYWGGHLLVTLMAIALDVSPDARVLSFTGILAVATGIAAGIAPVARVLRSNQSSAVNANAPRTMHSGSGARLGRGLMTVQLALSLVVVFAAVLLTRTFRNLQTLDPGFKRQNVLLFRLDSGPTGYRDEQLAQLYQHLLNRLSSAPGVRSASYSLLTPISGGGWDNRTYVEGYTPSPGESIHVYMNAVSTRFFETLGTPLLLGRTFGSRDQEHSTPVAVINKTMARRYFAGRNAIGRHIGKWHWDGSREYEVIGVVGDAKYTSLRDDVPPTAYLYLPQTPHIPQGVTFEVESAASASMLVPEMREALRSVDSRLAADDIKTLAQQVDDSLDEERLVCTVSDCFSALALVLACIGLYGLMGYSVTRRRSEIGLRMALGAQKNAVFRMILGQGMRLAALGLSIGVLASLMLAHMLPSFAHFLYGVRANDPFTILLAALALLVVALLACYVPAQRAMRVDPMVTLRCE
jgi:predicted permease